MVATAMGPYMAERRNRRRATLEEMVGSVCALCAATGKLEFDHRDPSTKSFQLSGPGLDRAWVDILVEFAKCQLLCRSCHRRKTVLNGETAGGRNRNTEPMAHGSMRCYQETRCRMEICRKARALYRKRLIVYRTVIPS